MNDFSDILDLMNSKKFDMAIEILNKKILNDPENPQAHFLMGRAKENLKDITGAVAEYKKAINLNPKISKPYIRLGIIFYNLKKYSDALKLYNKAIHIEKNNPVLFGRRALIFYMLNNLEESARNYDVAIQLNPNIAEYYYNYGGILHLLGRHAAALLCYERVVRLLPNNAEAYWIISNIKLLLGQYDEGWTLHESRWKRPTYQVFNRKFSKPQWTEDKDLNGKKILLYTESGFGDTIQFVRYIHNIDTSHCQIFFESPIQLFELLKSSFNNLTFIKKGDALPDFDYHCPIMSLPFALKKEVKKIPTNIPYLKISNEKIKMWEDQIKKTKKIKIGLAWSGSPNRAIDSHDTKKRSIPLELLEPILSMPVEFFSLQKEISQKDLEVLKRHQNTYDYHDLLLDFSETAALIKNLDLVISIDTSVAHLSASLGQKTIILLPYSSDYRWGLNDKSEWYPDATLIKQKIIGSWREVLEELVQILKKLLE